MNKLKTIEEYSAPKIEAWKRQEEEKLKLGTGVKCPKCEGELFRHDAYSQLASYPPQLSVYCILCKSETFILA
jgi:cytochrome c-type biogenesis protein CcmH/NrfF